MNGPLPARPEPGGPGNAGPLPARPLPERGKQPLSHLAADGLCAPPRKEPALSARSVSYAYSPASRPVFSGIDLDVGAGSMLAVLGNNGAGKSTLLKVLAGIEKPSSGSVAVGGVPLSSLSRREAARHIAFVAQQQRVPHLSVYDQVLLGRRPHIVWSLGDHDRQVVAEAIDRLDLARFSARYADELSGGERQKVFIARALAQKPEVLLLDEPTSALDPKNQLEVLEAIRAATREENLATAIVIHDVNLALRFCDEFLLLRDGLVVARGGREAVSDASLSATYDVAFRLEELAGVPLAIPLGGAARPKVSSDRSA